MPVSPADFEFYSRMTGQPIPNTPAGRMAIAPQVYNMRRGGGGFGRFLRGAAKGALAAGALAGAGALALATQEEMAKKPSAPKTETAKDQDVDLDSSAFTEPVESVRDKAEAFAAYTTGNVYNPQYSVGAPPKEKRARVTENLTDTGMSTETTPGGQKVTVSATDSPARMAGSPQILSGDALSAAEAEVFDDPNVLIGGGPLQNRISGQTQVPQADPNTAFESRGAQIASTSEPTQPRVEVRQQPSSGAQVTDLSNVAATESAPSTVREKTSDFIGRVFGTREQAPSQLAPYAALNREEQEIRDLLTAYEAVEGQALAGQDQSISPFQVGGAMDSLREQNEPVRVMQKSMPGASNQEIVSAMYAPSDPGGVRMQLPSTSGKPASVRFYPENRGEGGISAAKVQYTPGGKTYTFETSPEGLARLQGIQSGAEKVKSGKSFLRDAVSKGQLANPVDTFFASLKSESAPVQTAASEKQSPVELGKQMVSDAGKKIVQPILNVMGVKKADPREQRIRDSINKSRIDLNPSEREDLIQQMLGK